MPENTPEETEEKQPPARGAGAKNEISALSLYQLIGAPLQALIDAESQAAMATAHFIEAVGFEPGARPPKASAEAWAESDTEGGAELGQLRVARFHQHVRGPDDTLETRVVEIPMLSLVPIPALQIRDATLEYVVKIIDTQMYQAETGGLSRIAGPRNADLPERQVDFKAAFARDTSTSGRRSLDMQIKMKVNVEQADIPAGLARLINLMDQSVTTTALPATPAPAESPTATPAPPPAPADDAGDD